jgi:hypothetical protein
VAACAALAWPADSTLEPTDGGRPSGEAIYAQVFLACAFAAVAAYGLGLLALRRARPRLAAVALLAALIQLVPLGAPLLLSTDAWTYWAYGRIAAVHDGNPYRDTPSDFAQDAAYPYVGADWCDTTSVYGPAFTLASEPLALAAGTSANAAAWVYKTLAAGAVLAAAGLAARLARRRAFAFAFVGWNPLLALHFAGGGHNDAWVAVLVVGALAAAASRMSASPWPRSWSSHSQRGATGQRGSARSAHLPATRTPRRASPSRTASSSSDSPTGSRSARSRSPSHSPTSGCCARPGAGERGSGSRRCCSCSQFRTSRPGTSRGRFRSSRRRRTNPRSCSPSH